MDINFYSSELPAKTYVPKPHPVEISSDEDDESTSDKELVEELFKWLKEYNRRKPGSYQ